MTKMQEKTEVSMEHGFYKRQCHITGNEEC